MLSFFAYSANKPEVNRGERSLTEICSTLITAQTCDNAQCYRVIITYHHDTESGLQGQMQCRRSKPS